MDGKDKCRLINQIRLKVARNNDIDFVIYDCTFKGDCSGNCQKTDSELNYLESELEKRQNKGMKINLKDVFSFDIDDEPEEHHLEDISINRNPEKMEELMSNPELRDLPPRYLDMLL